jgi:hypothetical protein
MEGGEGMELLEKAALRVRKATMRWRWQLPAAGES